jgi:uncharacterized protein YndB with AHSA1/START domain
VTAAAGDQARVSVLVRVPPKVAFRAFTEEIDQWWRPGPRYRVAGNKRGLIHIEGGVGGRLFESFEGQAGTKVIETGRITAWDPPSRLSFEWRSPNYGAHERTFVDIVFEESPSGTRITVTHRGWSGIRPDHPARHGQEVAEFLRGTGLWWADLMTSFREHVEPPPPRDDEDEESE